MYLQHSILALALSSKRFLDSEGNVTQPSKQGLQEPQHDLSSQPFPKLSKPIAILHKVLEHAKDHH